MWNPWRRDKTPVQRIRELEGAVSDISADLEQIMASQRRIDARLRQRASRENRAGDIPAPGQPDLVASESHLEAPAADVPASYTKDQLREFARQRGLRS